ncbi:MAG: hypothetical protein KDD56_02990 [Bdellovibrionales bacterium]|nr:hypothetical protein [Bdellovibrionales bacterium]
MNSAFSDEKKSLNIESNKFENISTEGVGQLAKDALWVSGDFFRGVVVKSKVIDFARLLKANGIRYVYIFAGPFKVNGSLPFFAYSNSAKEVVRLLISEYPELVILPWIGGLQNKSVFLEKEDWVRHAVESISLLVGSLGVPGVHTDFELILPDSKYVLEERKIPTVKFDINQFGRLLVDFHLRLKNKLPNIFVSTVVGSTSHGVKLWKWQPEFDEIADLCKYTNQIALMFYDTKIKNKKDYEESLIEQLKHVRNWKESNCNASTDFLLGVGTFENSKPLDAYRDLKIENLENHFLTLKKIRKNMKGDSAFFDGNAIYANWTTDESEWETIRILRN